MEIKLNIKVPNDNTNEPHGDLILKTDNRYTYITIGTKTIAVDAHDFHTAVNALY